ncbi:MAG: NUDIX hydrolase [Archangiaceae bacterium]|nr:NUDIX hydrolase [Archangiaceae bacterium]
MQRSIATFVWKTGSGDARLALLQPSGAPDRWVLPGGDVRPDEPLRDAARRLANEALAQPVEVLGFVEASALPPNGRLYFDAELTQRTADSFETEQGRVAFVTPRDALSLLADEADRRLLAGHLGPATPQPLHPTPWQYASLVFSGQQVSARQLTRHLAQALADQRVLEAAPSNVTIEARRQLAEAQRNVFEDPELGWAMLKKARRTQLEAMQGEALRARWEAVREEAAEKLRGWRATAAKELMGEKSQVPGAHAIAGVANLLDEHHDAYFDRARLVQQRIVLLTALGLAVLTLFELTVELTGWAGLPSGLVRLAPLIGVLGAVCSALLSSVTTNASKRPQVIVDSTLILGRIALGATSGLGMALLVNTTHPTTELLTALVFIAGFSERALPAQIDRMVAADAEKQEK